MNAYGYESNDLEAESPRELRELTLSLSEDEFDVVIAFFKNAKKRFQTGTPTSGQSHLHLRDWWKEWDPSGPDLIVVYDAQ